MIRVPRWLEWAARIWDAIPNPVRWGALGAGVLALLLWWWT